MWVKGFPVAGERTPFSSRYMGALICTPERRASPAVFVCQSEVWHHAMPLTCGIIKGMRNFHVPLTDETYDQLRTVAERSKVPATTLAREAIDFWLRHQLRKARYEAIVAFA